MLIIEEMAANKFEPTVIANEMKAGDDGKKIAQFYRMYLGK